MMLDHTFRQAACVLLCCFWDNQSRLLHRHSAVDNVELIPDWLLVDALKLAIAIGLRIEAVHSHTDTQAALCVTNTNMALLTHGNWFR